MALLVVVVFLTLLQPKKETPLVGVNAPGPRGGASGGETVRPSDSDRGNDGDRRGSAGDRKGLRGAGSAGKSGGASTGGGATSVASAPVAPAAAAAPAAARPATGGAPPSAGNPDENSPTGDQYADTLARLAAGIN